MDKQDVLKVVEEINSFIKQHMWLDFEVIQFLKNRLTIIGGIDLSQSHDIKIYFEDVFFVSLPIEWKTDTTQPVFKLLKGDEAYLTNRRFQVEQGYHLFKFTPEDYPDDFGCLVGAKMVMYKVENKKNE